MEIILKNIGRRFNRDWIFKGVSYTFKAGDSYAILGRNGSGKSTLLQLVAGSLSPSEGTVEYQKNNALLDHDDIYQSLSIAAPYLELIEEFTLAEMIDFHFKFKAFLPPFNKSKLVELLELESSKNKAIKYFSSGMKQRVKLALAICADTPVVLLDEPASNLDAQAVEWYQSLVQSYCDNRILIICSNQEPEYFFCKHRIALANYK